MCSIGVGRCYLDAEDLVLLLASRRDVQEDQTLRCEVDLARWKNIMLLASVLLVSGNFRNIALWQDGVVCPSLSKARMLCMT